MSDEFSYIPVRVLNWFGMNTGVNVFIYVTGTTTLVALYSDPELTVPISNPVMVAYGADMPNFYYATQDVRLRIVQTNGVLVEDTDPYTPPLSTDTFSGFAETVGVPLSNWAKGTASSAIVLDETDKIQEAWNYAAANGMRLLHDPLRHYWATSLTPRENLRMDVNDATYHDLGSGVDTAFIVTPPGRQRYMDWRRMRIQGNGSTRRMCFVGDARLTAPGVGDAGLMDCRLDIVIRGFDGHSFWLRGGNARAGGTYDFRAPHQFNYFRLDIERPVGNVNGCAIVMTGQCGQNTFSEQCRFDGRKASAGAASPGLNMYVGREFKDNPAVPAATRLPGTPYDPAGSQAPGAIAGTNVDDQAPDAVWFANTTSQQANLMCWVDRGTVSFKECYTEDNARTFKLTATGKLSVTDTKFGNSGYDGAGGGSLVEYGSGCTVVGNGNYIVASVAPDWLFRRPDGQILRNPWIDGFFMGTTLDPTGKTSGATLDINTAPTINFIGYRTVGLYGKATPDVITNITSALLPNATIMGRLHSNVAVFASGGNLGVPGGRVVLRAGDGFQLTAMDFSVRLQGMFSIAPLEATSMPTTGYYETGEYVRNKTALGSGTVTLGWQRLTTGTTHVAGTDWRAIQATGA